MLRLQHRQPPKSPINETSFPTFTSSSVSMWRALSVWHLRFTLQFDFDQLQLMEAIKCDVQVSRDLQLLREHLQPSSLVFPSCWASYRNSGAVRWEVPAIGEDWCRILTDSTSSQNQLAARSVKHPHCPAHLRLPIADPAGLQDQQRVRTPGLHQSPRRTMSNVFILCH